MSPIEIELSDESQQVIRDLQAHVQGYTARRDALDLAVKYMRQPNRDYPLPDQGYPLRRVLLLAEEFHEWLTDGKTAE